MSEEGSREGFLSRWSRRKRAVREGEPPEEPVAAPLPEAAAPPPAPLAEEEPAPDLSLLPKLEDLTAESDLTPFFANGVPLALRQAALSRMWTLVPGIRDFVGPADYAWDFNAPDGVSGFGLELPEEAKALARRLLGVDREEQELAEKTAADAQPAPSAPSAAAPASVPVQAAVAPDFLPPTLLPEAAPEPPSEPEAAPAPRRRHGSALPT